MGYTWIRNITGLVLLGAAGLKAHQLATEPVAGVGLFDSRWFLIATVEFELLFGLWLLSGILPKQAWLAALGCFGLFTCVSLYKTLSGQASCGCFGRMSVNPWYTAVFDLAIVASLLRWRPTGRELVAIPFFKSSHFVTARLRALAVLVIWLAVGVPAAFAMGTYSMTTLSDAGQIIGDGQIVVLEPEKWIGKRFPLLDYIDIGEPLKEGKWLVLFYHHDCPKCLEVISDLQQVIRLLEVQRVALVEIPPYGNNNITLGTTGELTLLQMRMDNSREWFVESPLGILLDNGITVDSRKGNELFQGDAMKASWFQSSGSSAESVGEFR